MGVMATGLVAKRLAGRSGGRAGKLYEDWPGAGGSSGKAGKLDKGWPEGLKQERKLR
jgi:hypothetical protein